MPRMQSVGALGALILGLFLLAPSVLAAGENVSIAGFAFSPATVTVSVGDSVTWTNNDGATHTATADGGSFDTGNIAAGGSDSVTFNTAGSFDYHCTIHSQMTGTVVVQAASGGGGGTPTTPPTDTAPDGSSGTTSLAGTLAAVAFVVLSTLIVARRLARTPVKGS